MYKRVLLLLIVVGWLAGGALAQMPYYYLKGRVTVTTESGAIVPHRMVSFYKTFEQSVTAETDAYGSFEVNVFDLFYTYGIPITFESETYSVAVARTAYGAYHDYGTQESMVLTAAQAFTEEALVIIPAGGPLGEPTAAITTLRASIVEDKLVLDWMPMSGATSYNVYRGTDPYFTIEAAALITSEILGTAYGTDRLEWEDLSGAGVNDAANNYFYAVTALNGSAESSPSNRVGEYTYDLVKTSPTDYVWVAYVLDTNYSRTPATTLSALGALAPNLSAGYPQCFDVATQQLLPRDHTLATGEAIQLKITASGVLQLAGGVNPASFSLVEQSPTNYNWISLPLDHNPATLTELAAEIATVSAGYPQYFDVTRQQPIGSSASQITWGTPLQLKMTGPTTWP